MAMTHEQFMELVDAHLSEVRRRLSIKGKHYTAMSHPLANLAMVELLKVPAWKFVLCRMTEKFSRIQSFARTEQEVIKEESITEVLFDIAAFSIIDMILLDHRSEIASLTAPLLNSS